MKNEEVERGQMKISEKNIEKLRNYIYLGQQITSHKTNKEMKQTEKLHWDVYEKLRKMLAMKISIKTKKIYKINKICR